MLTNKSKEEVKHNAKIKPTNRDWEDDESLCFWDAADIWMSSGYDEDYMFGYTEEELRKALNA